MEVKDWHMLLHMLSTDQAVGEAPVVTLRPLSSLLSQGKLSGSLAARCQVGAEQEVDSGGSLGNEADGSTEIELKQ